MDAFAVSISNGIIVQKDKLKLALKLGLFFGGFQAIMPLIGWLAGFSFKEMISDIDHWIAFGLLLIIGLKMIYESFGMDSEQEKKDLSYYTIIILSIATSIDALAVGVSFVFLKVDIILPVILIGIITFVMSFLGVFLGNKFGKLFGSKIEIIGGLVLIGIGTKILIEHLYFQ